MKLQTALFKTVHKVEEFFMNMKFLFTVFLEGSNA